MPRGMSALRLKQLLHRSIVRHFSYKAPLIFEKAVNYWKDKQQTDIRISEIIW